ncbi:class I SAM-dependent methyltransferase [bacterium]|nr:class I SAM-dependent methyltransferase [bacterium]
MYTEIKKCRICGNTDLASILHLGNQYLTGVFPKTKEETITSGPIELLKCQEGKKGNFCGLLQLRQSYDLNEMYGWNYGYRSGLNQSMVEHLNRKVKKILEWATVVANDVIVDIGSNDSTLLKAYPQTKTILVGIDPAGEKFKKYYPNYIQLISDFFSAESFKKRFGEKKAKIITSVAMFYDLEDPLDFMKQVHEVLANDGVWVFEQSYMPTMLEKNAYDTICHEHLEHYRLKQIKWMTDRVGFKIIDIEFNEINGGSFSVMVAKSNSSFQENIALVEKVLEEEESKGLNTLKPYLEFKHRVHKHREELCQFIQKIKSENKLILGYGASTKGNVVLQFCGLTEEDMPFIAEVNEDKFGCYTPGTHIPIIPEEEVKAMKPDYLIVFPWHFKENFLKREKEYLANGGKLLMPLPEVEVIKI